MLPLGYILTATPYMWLGDPARLGRWASSSHIFPIAGGYSFALEPRLVLDFIGSLFSHWFLPFASLFLVMFGGWAIGMRNMIIYELEADYSHYLEALGAPQPTDPQVRLPQRDAAPDHRPGPSAGRDRRRRAGHRDRLLLSRDSATCILQAIQNQDYFLLQGCFLFIIIGVLLANFIIDIAYVVIDPRTRARRCRG